MRKSLLVAALSAVLPFYMSDVSAAGAGAEAPNDSASAAAEDQESGTTQSATTATSESGAVGAAAAGEAGNVAGAAPDASSQASSSAPSATASASSSADPAAAATNQNTGKVEIASNSHGEAKDRFAGLMAKLHQFEADTVEELKAELRAIGTLLHLHTTASSQADVTGDYKSTDL